MVDKIAIIKIDNGYLMSSDWYVESQSKVTTYHQTLSDVFENLDKCFGSTKRLRE